MRIEKSIRGTIIHIFWTSVISNDIVTVKMNKDLRKYRIILGGMRNENSA